MNWERLDHGPINMNLIEYLEKLFEEEMAKGHTIRVAVGTDSQKRENGFKFATAIVIIVEGNGAMIVYKTAFEKGLTEREINKRMLMEVSKSIEVGYEIWPLLDLYDIKLEIHADINQDPRWGSNTALNEAVGYVKGMGWTCKVKPDAMAASTAADNLC